jgi:hypothetical protein
MNAQQIIEKKLHGDSLRIMKIANKLAEERSEKTYSETTIRQQLNGTRTMKPIVEEAANLYYNMIQ